MPIAQTLLPEFDHEMATTRTLLERVPADRAEWRPHPKSTPMGELAAHLAELVGFGTLALASEEHDMSPPGGGGYQPPRLTTTDELLARFDGNVAKTRAALAASDDAALGVTWTLKFGGAPVFAMPRVAVMRTMVLNHIIHHRGQLSVYLRQNDVPLPSIYGPTADTQG
jgi:uncharacterized damage-inducible protein DinB